MQHPFSVVISLWSYSQRYVMGYMERVIASYTE